VAARKRKPFQVGGGHLHIRHLTPGPLLELLKHGALGRWGGGEPAADGSAPHGRLQWPGIALPSENPASIAQSQGDALDLPPGRKTVGHIVLRAAEN
jgi:hypothetical protein